jgi:hypothetical protein
MASAVDNVFRPVGAARNHKEGRGDQGPERQADGFFFLWERGWEWDWDVRR